MAFWKSANAHPVRSHEFKVTWSGALSHTVKSCTKPSIEVNGNEYQIGNQFFKYPGVAKWNDVTLTFVDDKSTTRRIFQQLIDQGLLIPVGQKRYGGMDLAGQEENGGSFGTTAEERRKEKRDKLNEETNASRELRGRKAISFAVDKPDPIFNQHIDDSMKKGKIGDILIEQHAVFTKQEVIEPTPGTLFRPPKPGGLRQRTSPGPGFRVLESWKLKNAWIKSINFGTLDYSSDELITIEVVISYDWCEAEFPRLPTAYD